MDYIKATDDQLKVIVESDGECPSSLLYPVLEEVVRRDLYKNYMFSIMGGKERIFHLESETKQTIDELKNLLYLKAFDALKYYKPGKNSFLSFWTRFMKTALRDEVRHFQLQCRKGNEIDVDNEDVYIQLVSDNNTERKVINRMMIADLFELITDEERYIVTKRYEGYTYGEIEKVLGYGRNYAKTKHKRMVKRLKGA